MRPHYGLIVHPWGVEPQSMEPESIILSIELWVLLRACNPTYSYRAVRFKCKGNKFFGILNNTPRKNLLPLHPEPMKEIRIESEWREQLAEVFASDAFRRLADTVRGEYAGSTPIYPPARNIFAAFDACPFSAVKVVIIGQDPYHGPGQANGLSFSVNPGVKMPPSLVNIFKEVHAETGAPIPPDGDLSRWAKQGVLLLNASLTVREHKPMSHANLGWQLLTDKAVERLTTRRSGIVFMLWGSFAIRKGAFIDRQRHLVLTSPHPSPLSAHRGFFGNGHFIAANRYLESHGEKPIVW